MKNNIIKLIAYGFAIAFLLAIVSCKSSSQNDGALSEKQPDKSLSSELAKKALGVKDEKSVMFEGLNAYNAVLRLKNLPGVIERAVSVQIFPEKVVVWLPKPNESGRFTKCDSYDITMDHIEGPLPHNYPGPGAIKDDTFDMTNDINLKNVAVLHKAALQKANFENPYIAIMSIMIHGRNMRLEWKCNVSGRSLNNGIKKLTIVADGQGNIIETQEF